MNQKPDMDKKGVVLVDKKLQRYWGKKMYIFDIHSFILLSNSGS